MMGCPRPRLLGCRGTGRRSTSLTNVTSNESWDTIALLLSLLDMTTIIIGAIAKLGTCPNLASYSTIVIQERLVHKAFDLANDS